jgi:hypothetical protein
MFHFECSAPARNNHRYRRTHHYHTNMSIPLQTFRFFRAMLSG